MRAIDAENIRIKPEFMHNVCGMAMIRVEDVVRILNDQPTIQPEIVRCKDCGHRDDHGCCKYWKALAIGDIPIATDDYDFCNHARRRANELHRT